MHAWNLELKYSAPLGAAPLPISRVLHTARDVARALSLLGRHGVTRTDVHAFGCAVYRMITGRWPHEQGASGVESVDAEPPLLPPETPPRLARTVARCLAVDPAARPASMGELARDFEQACLEYERAHVALESELESELESALDSIEELECADAPVSDSWSGWFLAGDHVPPEMAAELGWVKPPERRIARTVVVMLCAVIVAGLVGLAAVAAPAGALLDWMTNVLP